MRGCLFFLCLLSLSASAQWTVQSQPQPQWTVQGEPGIPPTSSFFVVEADLFIGNASGLTNLSIATDSVGSQQIIAGSVESDEIADASVSIAKLHPETVFNGDIEKILNTARVTKVYGSAVPNPASNPNKVLGTDGSGSWQFTTVGAGDMLKSTYDVNNNNIVDNAALASLAITANAIVGKPVNPLSRADGTVLMFNSSSDQYVHVGLSSLGGGDMLRATYDSNSDNVADNAEKASTALTAGTATNALRILGDLISESGKNDESVVTYDQQTDTYLHRDLSNLGGGDMLKATYDIDNDNKVDQVDVAIIGSTQITEGAVGSYHIQNSSITATDVDGTILKSTTSFAGGDVDGLYNSITVQKLQGKSLILTNVVEGQVLAINADGEIHNAGLGEITSLYDQNLNTTSDVAFSSVMVDEAGSLYYDGSSDTLLFSRSGPNGITSAGLVFGPNETNDYFQITAADQPIAIFGRQFGAYQNGELDKRYIELTGEARIYSSITNEPTRTLRIASLDETANSAGLSVYSGPSNSLNSLLYVRNDGKIGMGVTEPTERLHLSGNIKATGSINSSSLTTDYAVIQQDASVYDDLTVLDRATINGKVGIGGSVDEDAVLAVSNPFENGAGVYNLRIQPAAVEPRGILVNSSNTSGDGILFHALSGDENLHTTNRTKFVVNGNGTVGINKTYPEASLDIEGNARVSAFATNLNDVVNLKTLSIVSPITTTNVSGLWVIDLTATNAYPALFYNIVGAVTAVQVIAENNAVTFSDVSFYSEENAITWLDVDGSTNIVWSTGVAPTQSTNEINVLSLRTQNGRSLAEFVGTVPNTNAAPTLPGLLGGLETYLSYDASSFQDTLGSLEYIDHYAVTFTNDSKNGTAIYMQSAPSFSGNGPYLVYSNEIPYLNNATFAFSTWFKYEHKSGDYLDVLFKAGLTGSGFGDIGYAQYNYGILRYWPYDNQWIHAGTFGGGNQPTIGHFPSNEWNHLVINYDGQNVESFLNGELINSTPETDFNLSAGLITIGRVHQYDHWALNGVMDETATWNRPLTESEILQLYNNGDGLFYDDFDLIPTTLSEGVVSYVGYNDTFNATGNETVSFVESQGVTYDAVEAKYGKSAFFDENANAVIVYTNTAPFFNPTGFTYATWFKFSPTEDNYDVPCLYDFPYSGSTYATSDNFEAVDGHEGATAVNFTRYNNTELNWIYSEGVYWPNAFWMEIPENQWNLLVQTYDGNNMVFYLNGVVLYSETDVIMPTYNNGLIFYGKRQVPAWRGIDGWIDETVVWNRPLTTNEISQLYNGGSGFNLAPYFEN